MSREVKIVDASPFHRARFKKKQRQNTNLTDEVKLLNPIKKSFSPKKELVVK